MADAGPRFCPRCGTARVSGMPFCPNCGLNLTELHGALAYDEAVSPELDAGSAETTSAETYSEEAYSERPSADVARVARPSVADAAPVARPAVAERAERRSDRDEPGGVSVPGPIFIALLIAGVIVVLALNGSGLLRVPGGAPGLGGIIATPSPAPTPAGPTFAPTSAAPPVGLAILSPTDGAVVGSKQIVVIGSAPAGLRVVHDVPLWVDQATTSDGTGHWALTVNLNNGDNRLRFRLGDDKSTTRELRVRYSPPGG